MRIILVRHGETNQNIEALPLTEKGIIQAKLLANELKNYSFDEVYSSDLLRAKQTCEIFTKDYIEDKRLREIYRVLIGGPIKEGTPEEREFLSKERAESFFQDLLKRNKDVLIFCHGNLIRYYINKVFNSKENLWQSVVINNCSISILDFKEDLLRLIKLNSTAHLEEEIKFDLENVENYLP